MLIKNLRQRTGIKRNISFTLPLITKLPLYQVCVLSVVIYASQLRSRVPSEESNKSRKTLIWIIGTHGTTYKENFMKLRIIPIVFFFHLLGIMFFNWLTNGKYDMDPFKSVCLSLPTRSGLRSENKCAIPPDQ